MIRNYFPDYLHLFKESKSDCWSSHHILEKSIAPHIYSLVPQNIDNVTQQVFFAPWQRCFSLAPTCDYKLNVIAF